MSKKSWGILAGVSAILAFYLTAGTVGAWFILDAIASATNQNATLFDNWWQIVLLAAAIVSALAAVLGAVMFFGKEKTVSRGFFNPSVWSMFTTFFAIAMAIVIVGDGIAAQYASQINKQFGINPYKIVEMGDGDEDTEYYKSDYYNADGSYNNKKMRENSLKLALEVATEGSVLLWNDNNALPLAKDTKVNLFGTSSVNYLTYINGSGHVSPYIDTDMKTELEDAGLTVNGKLYSAYKLLRSEGYTRTDAIQCPGVDGNNPNNYTEAAINEAPWSAIDTTRAGNNITTTLYNDTAIMFISRIDGEEQDTYRFQSAAFRKDECFDDNYMDLSKNEADVLAHLQQLKAEGKIQKVVLVINSAMAVQFKNIRNYGIDACLWAGIGGNASYEQLALLLTGKANPSGHLPDTYVYDNFSAPSTENFGDFTFAYTTRPAGLPNEATYTHNDKYVVYQEGIYVGYRYYETRYADSVEGNGNAGGSAGVAAGSEGWKYSDEVAYPFGHGLSYTTFEYSNYSVAKKGDAYEVKMTIKNTGSVAGKDVMEVYLQKPYTEYDKATGIEKSAVELVGFAKTKELSPGESQTLTVTVDEYEFKSYDAYGKKTYIVEKGDYYLAAGADAHDALNNILAAKGYTVENGMTANGNGNMTHKITFANDDYTTYSVSPVTGNAVTNQFDDADVNLYEGTKDQKITYLSRNDWQGTYPSPVSLSFNATIVADMAYGPSSVEAPADMEMPKFGTVSEEYGELNLAMLMDVEFDNAYWDAILDQLTWEEAVMLIANDRRGAPSVGLNGIVCADGPVGLNFITPVASGLDSHIAFPVNVMAAATWNEELVQKMEDAFGMEILHAGITVLYGPGANIHRSAFSGRNAEYYSEDGFLSGKILSSAVQGLQGRGVIVCTKHFTLNEQERNRYGGTAWANEQSIRELYIKCFEAGFTEGKMNGVMTSFARIGCTWSGAHKGLLTGVCRNEWGFNGYFTTDAAVGDHMLNEKAMLAGVLAGQDTWLGGPEVSKFEAYKNNAAVATAIREACHRILYTRLHSSVMNGVSTTSKIVRITTWWESALNTAKTATLVVTGSCLLLVVLSFVIGKNKNEEEYEWEEAEMSEENEELKEEKKAVKAEKKAGKKAVKKSVKKNGKKKKGHPLATMMAIVLLGGVAAGTYLYFQPAEKPDDPDQGTPSTPITPDEPDTPDEPGDGIPDPTGTEYRFEAEEAVLIAGDTYGGLSISNENGQSTETFVGNFSGNLGARIIFYINAEKEGDVFLSLNLSKTPDRKRVTDLTAIFINDEWFESRGTLAGLGEGEREWITFADANLGLIHLKEGENKIELTQMESGVGFNVNRISLWAEDNTLTWGEYEAPKIPALDTSKSQYLFEAEEATLDGETIIVTNDNGGTIGNASGDLVVGKVNDASLNNPGKESITFTFTSDSAQEAVLAIGVCMPLGTMGSKAFTVTLNGTQISLPDGILLIQGYDPTATTSWTIPVVCGYNKMTLAEGENTLKFVINSGAQCNFDYIIINTDAVLTGGKLLDGTITPEPDTPNPEHACEHVCPDCGGCLDDACTDPVCADNRCECVEDETPVTGDKYLFEAEEAKFKNGPKKEDSETAHGGCLLGGVNDVSLAAPGTAYVEFTFTADKAGRAALAMGLAMPNGNVSASAFTVTLNGATVKLNGASILPDGEYAGSWESSACCTVATIAVQEGTNTLKFVINSGAQCNFDYIELTSESTLTLVPYVAPTPPTIDESKATTRLEAENATLVGVSVTNDNGGAIGNASGDLFVGGVYDVSLSAPGTASITFTFNSDSAQDAVLSLGLCMPTGSISDEAFTIKVNGVALELAIDGYSGTASWVVPSTCGAANISLLEGVNTIQFIINSGAQCNFDYIELNTNAVIS